MQWTTGTLTIRQQAAQLHLIDERLDTLASDFNSISLYDLREGNLQKVIWCSKALDEIRASLKKLLAEAEPRKAALKELAEVNS